MKSKKRKRKGDKRKKVHVSVEELIAERGNGMSLDQTAGISAGLFSVSSFFSGFIYLFLHRVIDVLQVARRGFHFCGAKVSRHCHQSACSFFHNTQHPAINSSFVSLFLSFTARLTSSASNWGSGIYSAYIQRGSSCCGRDYAGCSSPDGISQIWSCMEAVRLISLSLF